MGAGAIERKLLLLKAANGSTVENSHLADGPINSPGHGARLHPSIPAHGSRSGERWFPN